MKIKSKWEESWKGTSLASQSCRWKVVGGWPKCFLQALNLHAPLLWPDFLTGEQTWADKTELVDKWSPRMWFKSKVSVRKAELGARSTVRLEAPRLLKAMVEEVCKGGTAPHIKGVPESIQQKPRGLRRKMSFKCRDRIPKKEPDKTALLQVLGEMAMRC